MSHSWLVLFLARMDTSCQTQHQLHRHLLSQSKSKLELFLIQCKCKLWVLGTGQICRNRTKCTKDLIVFNRPSQGSSMLVACLDDLPGLTALLFFWPCSSCTSVKSPNCCLSSHTEAIVTKYQLMCFAEYLLYCAWITVLQYSAQGDWILTVISVLLFKFLWYFSYREMIFLYPLNKETAMYKWTGWLDTNSYLLL